MACDLCAMQSSGCCRYGMACVLCLARLILEHPKPMRRALITHWAVMYGHTQREVQEVVMQLYQTRNQACNQVRTPGAEVRAQGR